MCMSRRCCLAHSACKELCFLWTAKGTALLGARGSGPATCSSNHIQSSGLEGVAALCEHPRNQHKPLVLNRLSGELGSAQRTFIAVTLLQDFIYIRGQGFVHCLCPRSLITVQLALI